METQKTIEQFIEYLKSELEKTKKFNYNLDNLNEICKLINRYKEENNIILEDIFEEKEEESEDESENESEEEEEKEESIKLTSSESETVKSENENKNNLTLLFENFINKNTNIEKLFIKPTYDIIKNMETFIKSSSKY